jgi:hypothetical protein
MKNNIVLFITGCTLMLMASCLGSGDTYTTEDIKDAQIASLVLAHDSITGLGNVKFTIDQVGGFIFNNDSLPYGTTVEKVVCTLTYSTGVNAIKVIQKAVGDTTIWWNGTDSLDFSQPVEFTTTAYDGLTTKTYTARVNIHQEQPDSMVWEPYATLPEENAEERHIVKYTYEDAEAYLMYVKTSASRTTLYYTLTTDLKTWLELPLTGLPETVDITQITLYENTLYAPAGANGLYQSTDGSNWTKTEDSPAVKAILGVLNEGYNTPSLLALMTTEGDSDVFAGMNKDKQWLKGNTVPDNFPVSGFGHLSYNRMNHAYLSVVAGKNKKEEPLNTTWSTANATEWVLLSGKEGGNFFEKKAGVMLALYDDKFYLMGGINAENKASKEIHLSQDNGTTWYPADSLKSFPEEYKARGYASIYVDAANYILIFGGKTSKGEQSTDDLWRGRINRLK